jgi:hypothetical protein
MMIVVINCNNEKTIIMKKITKSRRLWWAIANCNNEKTMTMTKTKKVMVSSNNKKTIMTTKTTRS